MFQEGNYDIIDFPAPIEGMNQFISPEILPPQFCHYLENMTPSPLGSCQVRYGTRLINSVGADDNNILEEFYYVKADGTKQLILYVQSYTQDTTVNTEVIVNQTTITFNSTGNAAKYVADTPIKILYTLDAANYILYSTIKAVAVAGVAVTLTLEGNLFPNGGVQLVTSIYYSVGQIYSYSFSTNTFSGILQDGLSVSCIPRSVFFQQTLLIYNGVDRLMTWDGTTLSQIVDYVKEVDGNTFNRVDNTHFTFVATGAFDATKYGNNNLIQLTVNGAVSNLTNSAIAIAGNIVTLTTLEVLPAFTGANIVQLFYRDWPPPFNYIYAGPDRLWALGPGPASITWRVPNEALRFYYTYIPNTLTKWFDENSKTVPSIDVSDKHGIPDNLEAICQVNGLTALMGRSKTQVWSGSIPGVDFAWASNIPVGIAHGNLLVPISNDAYFVSQAGLQTFSTLNIARQFAATSSNAVDPIINNYLETAMSSNIEYRACRAFKYEQGNLGGFKIGRNNVLVSLFQNTFYAWSFFSGDFNLSNTFVSTDNALYMAIKNSIFQYADGNDGSPKLYADNNNTAMISFTWVPGLTTMGKRGKRYASRRYELILNYPSEFTQNPLNVIKIVANGYISYNCNAESIVQFQNAGDLLGTAPIGNFRLSVPFNFVNQGLKFVSSGFWMRLTGYTFNGPLSFKQLKLFGIGERNA